MEVKIINNKLDDFGRKFKVRKMNFDNIIVNYPIDNGMKNFSFSDVECISENDIDKFLIKNRSFLKIKLKRGISVVFYNALYDSIKFDINGEIEEISVIKDKYKINNRGIWEKEIILIVNYKFALEVMASGKNFKREGYNIIINRLENNSFLEICHAQIKNIESEIQMKSGILYGLRVAIDQFQNANKIYQEL